MSKFRISSAELSMMKLPERYSANVVASKIRLPAKSNALTSLDLDLTPYTRLPIWCIGKESVLWIGVIAGTQMGKSVILQVGVADMLDQAPNTALYVLPDEKSAGKQMDEKIIGMVRSSPFLSKYVLSYKDLNKTQLKFSHMTMYPAWSNSLASLSSTPASRIFLDEVRLFRKAIGKESNAIKLATDRLTTFRAFGMAQGMMVSTPSEEGDLLHDQLFVHGTIVLVYYSRCPKCGSYQRLDFFKNVIRDRETGRVYCKCSYCDGEFESVNMKKSWNKDSKYGYVGQDGNKEIYLTPDSTITESDLLMDKDVISPLKGRVFFWVDSLNSPFRSFEMIFQEFLETKDDINAYKNFYQCWLARFWKNTKSTLDRGQVEEKINDIPKCVVPEWAKTIVAGVDTQDDGFYVTMMVFGHNMRGHILDYFFIPSNMHTATEEQLVELFEDNIENRAYFSDNNREWRVGAWSIDTGGHRTIDLYPALARMERVFMIKGAPNTQKETITYTGNIDNLYLVRTDEYAEETEQVISRKSFSICQGVSDEFIKQFLAYKKVEEINNKTGQKKITWKKDGQNDYRMAVIHCYITMDLAESRSMYFRQNTGNPDWEFNPIIINNTNTKTNETIEELPNSFESYDRGTGYFDGGCFGGF